MILTPDERRVLVELRLEKSDEAMRDAKEFCANHPDAAVGRAYYGAFHAAGALLVCSGLELPKTHRGLNSVIYKEFAEKGLFPIDIARHLGFLEMSRSKADYGALPREYDTGEATEITKKAEEFCLAVKKFIAETQ